MNLLCVVTEPFSEADVRRMSRGMGRCALSVLDFVSGGQDLRPLERAFGAQVEQRFATRELMEEVLPEVREKFVRFCAEWPDRPLRDGKGLKALFVQEGLSLWWLCELSQKETEGRPTFTFLCQVEVLRRVLSASRYDRVVLLTRDRDQRAVFTQLCGQFKTPVVSSGRLRGRKSEGIAWLFLGRVKDWGLALLAALAASLVARRPAAQRTSVSSAPARRIVFYTWYPSQWTLWRGAWRDRYYVHLPDVVSSQDGWHATYLCSVPSLSLSAFLRNWTAVARLMRSPEGAPFEFLERLATPWRICRLYGACRTVLRYLWLELADPAFKASFAYDDLNIFPVARYDLRVSFIRQIPHHLLHMNRMKRFVQLRRPAWLVTTLETYCSGRVTNWAVRSSGVGTKVAGYQHSPVNANQLMYRYRRDELAGGTGGREDAQGNMPIPDVFILHGLDAKRMLEASGVPSARLQVCGSARFDDLLVYRDRRRSDQATIRQALGIPPALRPVLVAGDIRPAMTRQLLRLCLAATADRNDVVMLFKPHPLHQRLDRKLTQAMRETPGSRWMCSDEPLNLLQAGAAVMVTANSTADVEAIVIGCPVIRVLLTGIGSSPSIEAERTTLNVASAVELAGALDRVLTQQFCPSDWPELEARVFYRLDGRAPQRFLSALDRPLELEPCHADR